MSSNNEKSSRYDRILNVVTVATVIGCFGVIGAKMAMRYEDENVHATPIFDQGGIGMDFYRPSLHARVVRLDTATPTQQVSMNSIDGAIKAVDARFEKTLGNKIDFVNEGYFDHSVPDSMTRSDKNGKCVSHDDVVTELNHYRKSQKVEPDKAIIGISPLAFCESSSHSRLGGVAGMAFVSDNLTIISPSTFKPAESEMVLTEDKHDELRAGVIVHELGHLGLGRLGMSLGHNGAISPLWNPLCNQVKDKNTTSLLGVKYAKPPAIPEYVPTDINELLELNYLQPVQNCGADGTIDVDEYAGQSSIMGKYLTESLNGVQKNRLLPDLYITRSVYASTQPQEFVLDESRRLTGISFALPSDHALKKIDPGLTTLSITLPQQRTISRGVDLIASSVDIKRMMYDITGLPAEFGYNLVVKNTKSGKKESIVLFDERLGVIVRATDNGDNSEQVVLTVTDLNDPESLQIRRDAIAEMKRRMDMVADDPDD